MSVIDPIILNQLSGLAKSMADAMAALSAAVANVDGDVAGVGADLATVSGKVTTVNNAVATLQGTANTINNAVATLNAKATGVKSVQRGVFSSGTTSTSTTFTVAPVNVSKSLLYVSPAGLANGQSQSSMQVHLIDATTIGVSFMDTSNFIKRFVWELIEFY